NVGHPGAVALTHEEGEVAVAAQTPIVAAERFVPSARPVELDAKLDQDRLSEEDVRPLQAERPAQPGGVAAQPLIRPVVRPARLGILPDTVEAGWRPFVFDEWKAMESMGDDEHHPEARGSRVDDLVEPDDRGRRREGTGYPGGRLAVPARPAASVSRLRAFAV